MLVQLLQVEPVSALTLNIGELSLLSVASTITSKVELVVAVAPFKPSTFFIFGGVVSVACRLLTVVSILATFVSRLSILFSTSGSCVLRIYYT
ncbi:MAG: hypothetical protein K9L17_14205 [Clostridiales bacterium]|nr:hypothetical protein [Clostridiales bacterium]MCF8023822.1 hypothetical protein [Clostridiales bacterium]